MADAGTFSLVIHCLVKTHKKPAEPSKNFSSVFWELRNAGIKCGLEPILWIHFL